MKTLPRHITPRLLQALNVSPVVFLNGARQSGKSTLVQNLREQIGRNNDPAAYVSFDRPTQMAAASSAPESFLSAYKDTLIIDEVQLVPELFRALKVVVDELRLQDKANANGRYLLTGSANILALPKLSDPLVGRMTVLTLYPFCTAEASQGKGNGLDRLVNLDFTNISNRGLSITDAMKLATFPEIADKNAAERGIWFDGYLTTILQRDVRLLAELEKISVLPNLLRILAIRSGSLLNDADVARDIGLNPVTSKLYRNILKMMFLNFDVEPWYRNIGKRLVKSPKGYLTDTLMLCHMLDLNLEDIEKNKPDLFGHVLENYIATELTKLLTFSETKAKLLHFRTSDGKEADFVLEKPDGSVFAIEIKKSESVNIHDFKGIQTLAELTEKEFIGGVVLYSGKEVVPFGKNLWAVPFHILWQ
ncbi:AAA family ATPase [Chitinophaga oryziterrae]|uniref:AAA family ATPase n=1 Tax=Chitinophaga oryziterrae TaxID=1031224 RepID=A0A6N8J3S1_9BACT|nr:ATP-binding protein [Chitinophaga oryziterrae]MVT39875.1 AAA family ATPase [Chitinophaga oryziterrae]